MGKYEKKTKRGFPVWIVLVLVVCVAAAAVVLIHGGIPGMPGNDPTGSAETSGATETPTETTPETLLQILSSEEQGEYVVVTTNYCTVRYPFAFSDLIRVAAESGDREALTFSVLIGDTAVDMFAIYFDDSGAIDLGSVTVDEDGQIRALTADIWTVPDILDEDGRNTYLAAQESFNDVVASLAENENVELNG